MLELQQSGRQPVTASDRGLLKLYQKTGPPAAVAGAAASSSQGAGSAGSSDGAVSSCTQEAAGCPSAGGQDTARSGGSSGGATESKDDADCVLCAEDESDGEEADADQVGRLAARRQTAAARAALHASDDGCFAQLGALPPLQGASSEPKPATTATIKPGSHPRLFTTFSDPLGAANGEMGVALPGGPAGVAPEHMPGALHNSMAALAQHQPAVDGGQPGFVAQPGRSARQQYCASAVEGAASAGDPLCSLAVEFFDRLLGQEGISAVPKHVKGGRLYAQSYGGGGGSNAARGGSRRGFKPRGRRQRFAGGLKVHRHGFGSTGDFCTRRMVRERIQKKARVAICWVFSARDSGGRYRRWAAADSRKGGGEFSPHAPLYVTLMTVGRGTGQLKAADGSGLLHGTCLGAPPLVEEDGDLVFLGEVGRPACQPAWMSGLPGGGCPPAVCAAFVLLQRRGGCPPAPPPPARPSVPACTCSAWLTWKCWPAQRRRRSSWLARVCSPSARSWSRRGCWPRRPHPLPKLRRCSLRQQTVRRRSSCGSCSRRCSPGSSPA